VVQVDAEAAEARDAERGVGDAALAILPPRVRRQRGHDGFLDFDAVERRRLERTQHAVDAHGRRGARDEQQVDAVAGVHLLEPADQTQRLAGGLLRAVHRRVQLFDEAIDVVFT
jgi:hypothetical protein